jgi:tetraacyldisaccharide 4'-kinase
MINWERHWYRSSHDLLTLLLLPLSGIFRCLVSFRRFLYRKKILKSERFPVPVIVVGNITVGGTGKTPFVIWLVQLLKQKGFKPGIVSRGVGGKQQREPRWVNSESNVREVGDEAMLLAKRSQCPVVIGIDRVAAVKELLAKTDCNIVLSDDGLQHYRLARDIEIAIVDAARGLGNQSFLPAGPLRESAQRLQEVDFVLSQESKNIEGKKSQFPLGFHLAGENLFSVHDERNTMPLKNLSQQTFHAVAAIGNPQRFFSTLRSHGLKIIEHVFPDHYQYQKEDLNFADDFPIVMTEKDAVKCRDFLNPKCWYLLVNAVVDREFQTQLLKKNLFS